MPTDAQHRWADRFDQRYRFGIPALPIRKAASVPPSIVALPPRAGSMKFSEDDVSAVIGLLADCTPGQAVRLTEKPDDKENTSRRRAEIMKEQIETRDSGAGIPDGYKLRGHVLTAGEPTVKKISGKNYKFYPENWAAVSLVVDTEPDDTPDVESPENPGDTPPEENPGDTPPPATAGGRGRRS